VLFVLRNVVFDFDVMRKRVGSLKKHTMHYKPAAMELSKCVTKNWKLVA